MFNKLIRKFLFILFLSYHRIRQFLYLKNFEKKHLSFGIVNGKFQLMLTEHSDFIIKVQSKLDEFSKTNSQKDFIKLALAEALGGCNYIIFSPENDDNTFIQFWTGENGLKFNYYANKVNKLEKYYLSFIGLLSEAGFVNETTQNYRGSMIYKIDRGADHISIDADFKSDIDSATKFATMVFQQIYKTGNKQIIAKVE